MVDFGKFDKIIKISGKVDKSNSYNGFSCNISSLFKEELLQTKFFNIFYILAIGEKDFKNGEKVKRNKGRERV